MSQIACPITGLPAEKAPKTGDGETYTVPLLGVRYKISGTAAAELNSQRGQRSELDYRKLAYWLMQEHRRGNSEVSINSKNYKKVMNADRSSIRERIASYLRWLNAETGGNISRRGKDVRTDNPVGIIASLSEDENECASIVQELEYEGYLRSIDTSSSDNLSAMQISLTLAGLEYLEDLTEKRGLSEEVFLAMWFDSSMDALFEHLEKSFEEEADLSLVRVDRVEHNNKIDDEIIAALRRSRLVLADFTCPDEGKLHRGGVYYEAGFAHGLNKNVIFLVRDDCVDGLHFDTRQYNHIVWKQNETGEIAVVGSEEKSLGVAVLERIRAIEGAD